MGNEATKKCRATGPGGFVCTEPLGHSGEHVAKDWHESIRQRWGPRHEGAPDHMEVARERVRVVRFHKPAGIDSPIAMTLATERDAAQESQRAQIGSVLGPWDHSSPKLGLVDPKAFQEEFDRLAKEITAQHSLMRGNWSAPPRSANDAETERSIADVHRQRANYLADECGRLRDENRDLLAENARLRRRVEALERKR